MTYQPISVDEFNKLEAAAQRVLIAQDVIFRIQQDQYKPDTGNYVRSVNREVFSGNNANLSVQTHFDKINCRVCALGACLLSMTYYKNQLTFDEVNNNYTDPKVTDFFATLFSPEQTWLIERAFEGNVTPWGDKCLKTTSIVSCDNSIELLHLREVANDYRQSYNDNKKRLVAIMENIINNNGTFIP